MITNLETFGFNAAMRGMRNPKNSWHLSDTHNNEIGPNDKKLAFALTKSGHEHRKFSRMIHAQFDLTLPRYVWSEFDTYKIGTTANSCSTMHKLLDPKHEIDKYDFNELVRDDPLIELIIKRLNYYREEYLKTNDTKYLILAKNFLPESYLQKRTIDTNYEQLLNMYFQRKNHRLPEWKVFCNKLLSEFPYFNEFVGVLESEK